MDQIQELFFKLIKEKIPKEKSPAQFIAELLNVTTDGAYRRLRGDTPLRLYEAIKLSKYFGISLDELQGRAIPGVYTFRRAGLNEANLDFKAYLQNLLALLNQLKSQQIERVIFACKDIPVFHLYEFPELTLFKIFYWKNTIFNDDSLKGKKFSLDEIGDYERECLSLARQVAEKYAIIPTIEIWSVETSYSLMKQIEYYAETQRFASEEDLKKIIKAGDEYFKHLEEECSRGYKFLHDKPPKDRVENFTLYYNDLISIDNIIHINYRGDKSQTFMVYHSIEYLNTEDQEFGKSIEYWLENLYKKSDMISTVGERPRNKFFRSVNERMMKLKENLGFKEMV
ncbi:MAG: hypothetical protein MRZ79_24895 [Bacteroidia bacterium]|nr:hypothetical protein [Bacteroidia bacterium]